MKRIDLTNQKFGRLTAIKPTKKRISGATIWICRCDCGKECQIDVGKLKSGNTKSCGCLQKEMTRKRSITHGCRRTAEYNTWSHIKDRCLNPKNKAYKNYGGRGIKVCDRWLSSFENFLKDMGGRPKGLSLDRWPDNDGNYESSNCRWATRKEQRINSRPKSFGRYKQRWFYGHGPNAEMIIENNQSHINRIFKLPSGQISRCLQDTKKTYKGWTFQWIFNPIGGQNV